MTLSTTTIVLRVDCITEIFGRIKRCCSGDIGGVGYCVEFFRQKNIHKLLLDSMLTLWYTRASLYIWAIYGQYVQSAAISPPKKKLKKIKIPPCVSERLMVDYAALRLPQVKTTTGQTVDPTVELWHSKLQGQITGCAHIAR